MSEHATTTDVVYAKSRVLLVDQYDAVLLLLTRHDVDGYPARWLTTGGHLEVGEDHPTAAIRELFEETGLVIGDPGMPFWTHDFVAERAPGVWASHHEVWYAVRTQRFELDTSNWTPEELVDIVDQRWWSVNELDATIEPVEPVHLARLVRRQIATC
ncbi:NUDIX hydrolase [Agreia sp.]|uniref:NUDIX hydrolase n=1 Tax=Agreia sp. TaxID=1872416 RepID=UPI0035BC6493